MDDNIKELHIFINNDIYTIYGSYNKYLRIFNYNKYNIRKINNNNLLIPLFSKDIQIIMWLLSNSLSYIFVDNSEL